MMLMVQGATSDNYLSLSERISVPSGYTILVRFISEDTLVDTTTLPVTVSGTHAYRYHKLTITEKVAATDLERVAGNVTLDPYGTMLYEVYQTEATTSTLQASGTVTVINRATDGDTFTIHFPAIEETPATDLIFTFKDTPTAERDIAVSPTDAAMQGFLFAQTVGSYLQANGIGLFLNSDPNPATIQNFLAVDAGVFDGEIGNGIILSWSNASIFSETSPVQLSGGGSQVEPATLDYTLATKLLEVGKCLVTKNAGFDSFTEYTGATS